jgi:hypothetical protein
MEEAERERGKGMKKREWRNRREVHVYEAWKRRNLHVQFYCMFKKISVQYQCKDAENMSSMCGDNCLVLPSVSRSNYRPLQYETKSTRPFQNDESERVCRVPHIFVRTNILNRHVKQYIHCYILQSDEKKQEETVAASDIKVM